MAIYSSEHNYTINFEKVKTVEDVVTILKALDIRFFEEYVESQGDELKQFMTINPNLQYIINFEKVKTIEDVITILKPFEHDYEINLEKVKTVEDVATVLKALDIKFHEEYVESQGDEFKQLLEDIN